MITFLIGAIVKSLFSAVVTLLVGSPPVYNGIFGSFWTELSSRVATIASMDGVSVGLGIFDTFVGIDFIAWATGLAVTVVVTVRMIRLIMGLFSKA
jgi:hypothetical protein